ncbi:hypothetical protein HOU00_gp230 [Caulobacter phage CcrPW]|uniref:Uncharacterized protein n=1 Tax=Caulobacter phage CcrPW TaxID=2283271 RepID=A0A385ED20_9CAUD|nr:hypothetical protein HOU00_gp230 [Caulobacter phage CcrPW]AXQ68895.1 hypothetical protein CcrPW_gp356 [Caulobacter phage CcrPW]
MSLVSIYERALFLIREEPDNTPMNAFVVGLNYGSQDVPTRYEAVRRLGKKIGLDVPDDVTLLDDKQVDVLLVKIDAWRKTRTITQFSGRLENAFGEARRERNAAILEEVIKRFERFPPAAIVPLRDVFDTICHVASKVEPTDSVWAAADAYHAFELVNGKSSPNCLPAASAVVRLKAALQANRPPA